MLHGIENLVLSGINRGANLGVETVFFGRDYPHAEGTWPHTADWLSDADRRKIFEGNTRKVYRLDRVAARHPAVA